VQLNKNIKLIINYFFGPLVFLLLTYTIYHQLSKQLHWQDSMKEIRIALAGPSQWKIWATIVLMLLNWGFEAKKWQLSNKLLQRVSFVRAYKAVLTGISIASFTPNRMGEYLGRMLYIDEGKRMRSVALTIVGSIAQLLVTLICGIIGIFYLQSVLSETGSTGHLLLQATLRILLVGILLLLVGLLICYFRLDWLVSLAKRIDPTDQYMTFVKVLKEVPTPVLLQILCLSFVRYLVFMIQYYLLFSVFGLHLSGMQLFGGISVMFLIMAVVPTFTFLTDLGLRWESGIQIMALFSSNLVGIFAASFGIWLINLIIPALIGSLLILGIKIFRNR
jgi:Lysylphosphatidylglycerol synthase TM region